MGIVKELEKEIFLEERILQRYDSAKYPEDILICKTRRGKPRFFIRKKNENKQLYIGQPDFKILKDMYQKQLNAEIAKVLKNNIYVMQKMVKRLYDYGVDSVAELLPAAYIKLRDVLESDAINEGSRDVMMTSDAWISKAAGKSSVVQSENSKDRKGLKHRTSFDLMVRSKNEMLIAEGIYASGLEFRYEKRLELVTENPDGYNTEPLYPDFTIKLSDGTLIYWEHLGMMDRPDYQRNNFEKMKKYLSNGIYPPKNLILTFDGDDMPFDNSATWRVIEGLLLSRQ